MRARYYASTRDGPENERIRSVRLCERDDRGPRRGVDDDGDFTPDRRARSGETPASRAHAIVAQLGDAWMAGRVPRVATALARIRAVGGDLQ
jgi:hypothetical protein